MNRIASLTRFLPACLAALLAGGCRHSGPQLGTVNGTVTLGGKPLPGAEVVFQPGPGGSPSYARTDENGHYELMYTPGRPGAVVGEHTVRITTFHQYHQGDDGPLITVPERVPEKYNLRSVLKRQVEPGHNQHDFAL